MFKDELMKLFSIIAFFLFSHSLLAETISSFKVSENNINLSKISKNFEIVQKLDKKFLVYVLEERIKDFKKLAPKATLDKKDVNDFLKNKSKIAGYHSFDEIIEMTRNFEKQYPNLAKIESYGKSKNGLDLFSLKLTSNVQSSKKEKRSMLTSATHGDELITVEVLLELTKEILEGYGNNDRFTKILDNSEVYMIFVVNPEGFTRRSRYANGIDPNRQYPWPGNPNRRTPVPAIDALMDFYKAKNFKGSIDYHAYGKMVMFPWGYTRDLVNSSDHDHFDELTRSMAKENRYKHGPISRVIYVAKGSSADFYYEHNSGLALAVELGSRKVPRQSQISKVVHQAREMTWKFLEEIAQK
jgi:predicted deacylase